MPDNDAWKVSAAFGSLVERLHVNLTDPSPDLPDGERSTLKHPNPILSDVKVRKALSMAIDRQLLAEVGYGLAGKPTCNLVPAPEAWRLWRAGGGSALGVRWGVPAAARLARQLQAEMTPAAIAG